VNWKKVWKPAGRVRLFLLALWIFVPAVRAHEPSKSYLSLTIETNQITGRWDIPLRDLQTVVPLGIDKDGFVTLEKLQSHYAAVTAYALAHLTLKVDGSPVILPITNTEPTIEDFADGAYVELPFTVENLFQPKMLELNYQLFFETNSLHRGLLRLEYNGQTQSAIFTPDQPAQKFEIGVSSPGKQFLVFLREGIWHIWTGYDHILFLLALLLPSVLQREAGAWRGVNNFRPACVNILKIVTAFTLAHSLTLSLAALGIVKLPSRLTESAIAASVVLAAANNIWPLIRERGWMVAFGFGLIHGFGFANALSDLGLVHGALALTLLGFNLGVEVGQLAIVAVFLPLAFGLRRSWFYQKPLLQLGSALIIMVASVWLMERVFNFELLALLKSIG
jgi:HupE / UreJ protein